MSGLRPHSAHEERSSDLSRHVESHAAALTRARESQESAGQTAARELEVDRIYNALHRAENLPADVAAAIEAEATL